MGYDVELERERLDFEKLNFKAEFAWKKQELEVAEGNRIELFELQKEREKREDQERKVQIAPARIASKTKTEIERACESRERKKQKLQLCGLNSSVVC